MITVMKVALLIDHWLELRLLSLIKQKSKQLKKNNTSGLGYKYISICMHFQQF